MPSKTRVCPVGRWEPTSISYRGCPVYVHTGTGDWAYEADGERLVEMPEAVVDAICDIKMMDWGVQEVPEVRLVERGIN